MEKQNYTDSFGNKVVINICTTPEDYTKMFSVQCGSCMVLGPKGWGNMGLWHEIKDTYNLYPASWYHYTGYSRGVFIELDGIPIARCMNYRVEKDEDFQCFSDIKSTSYGASALIHNVMMDVLGLVPLNERYAVNTQWDFVVPGIECSEGIVCPLPHCDMNAKDFSVTFNEETKEFHFYPDDEAPEHAFHIASTYDHDGYLNAVEVLAKRSRRAKVSTSITNRMAATI